VDPVDYGNPAYDDNEHTCMHCEKPISKPGYCSNSCFEADML